MEVFNGECKEDSDNSDDVQMTLEGSGDDGVVRALTLCGNGQYQLRGSATKPCGVTYRVVQVTQGEDGQPRVITDLTHDQNILDGISNGESPSDDSAVAGAPRFAYITTNGGAELDTSHGLEAISSSAASDILNSAGPFYLMMSPGESLQTGHRQLAPRYSSFRTESGVRVSREDRRRATHNEVERRRRDKINCWIGQLSKLVPDCSVEQSKQGDSKGGILSKTCEYILELQAANAQMAESLKDIDRITSESELLRHQYDELKLQNEQLRAELVQHGIEPPDFNLK